MEEALDPIKLFIGKRVYTTPYSSKILDQDKHLNINMVLSKTDETIVMMDAGDVTWEEVAIKKTRRSVLADLVAL